MMMPCAPITKMVKYHTPLFIPCLSSHSSPVDALHLTCSLTEAWIVLCTRPPPHTLSLFPSPPRRGCWTHLVRLDVDAQADVEGEDHPVDENQTGQAQQMLHGEGCLVGILEAGPHLLGTKVNKIRERTRKLSVTSMGGAAYHPHFDQHGRHEGSADNEDDDDCASHHHHMELMSFEKGELGGRGRTRTMPQPQSHGLTMKQKCWVGLGSPSFAARPRTA